MSYVMNVMRLVWSSSESCKTCYVWSVGLVHDNVFTQKYLYICKRRCLELLKDYDKGFLDHVGANVVADALNVLCMVVLHMSMMR